MLRKTFNLTTSKNLLRVLGLFILLGCSMGASAAQDLEFPLSFSADGAVVSKYIWRGQRLTNDVSLQPAMTLGVGNFSFNVWGSMDLTAVNPGDALFLPEDPSVPAGSHSGLKGKFSEVDYAFSYAHSIEDISIDAGAIFYTFPERSASLASTTEIYCGVAFDAVPLAPSFTLYVDADETGASGDTGLYLLLSAGHFVPFGSSPVFTGLDISGSISFANEGFGQFYYGAAESGAHDANVTFSVPIAISESVSAGAFVSYSALVGGFRDYQFLDSRDVFLGTARSPATYADTLWGGVTLNLSF